MTKYFSQQILDEIKSRLSIKEVVSDYLPLSKDGSNWKALCPFHKEKTPSFKVHEGKGIYHCFGCGESGNIFTFLMKMEGLSFPEAVERLAKRAGVQLPAYQEKKLEKEEEKNARLFRINQMAQKFYSQKLFSSEGELAFQYLLKRGLKKEDMEKFGLGYAPEGWDHLLNYLKGRGVPESLALEAGLILPRDTGGYYDRFRNRVIFPIRDLLGRVRGFGARVLDDSLPKYINSPESPIYKKGESLYGIELAKEFIRKKDRAIIVEGYFDRIQLALAGFEEAVASLGTAFTEAQARMVARYTDRVFLVFDSDEAGRKASIRALEIFLRVGIFPFLVLMPEGNDPDDLVRKQGAEAFESLLETAPRLLDWYLETEIRRAGTDPAERGKALRGLVNILGNIPRALERELYLKKLAQISGVSESTLARLLSRERFSPDSTAEQSHPKEIDNLFSPEGMIIYVLVSHQSPQLAEMVLEQGVLEMLEPELSDFVSQFCQEILSQGKADAGNYFHLLAQTSWSRVLGRAIAEPLNLNPEQSAKAIKDAIFKLREREVVLKEQELNRLLEEARQKGDEEKIMQLLEEKSRLIEKKRHQMAQKLG